MTKYKRKPVVVEALQWTGKNIGEIIQFMSPIEPIYMNNFSNADKIIGIPTIKGLEVAEMNDWIIKLGENGFFPCKYNEFEQYYEKVE